MPVLNKGKTRGAVAAGHPATAEAAVEMLGAGGSAFDAALAAMAAAAVAEPVLASLGGGGFLLAAGPACDPTLFDFFVTTPRRRRPRQDLEFYPIATDFGPATQEFHIGLGALATPGFVHGLFEAHRRLGRLPMTEILAPATALARDGLRLRPVEARIFEIVAPIYTASAAARALYGRGDGLLASDDLLTQPELAATLEALGRDGARLFYEGDLAAALARFCREEGGQLTAEDLAGYRTVPRRPLERHYHGARILTNPPPSTGGLLIAFALDLLARDRPTTQALDAPARLASLARGMALTNRARIEARLHEATGKIEEDAAAARLFDPDLLSRYRREVQGRPAALRGTTHISVADAEGNLASLSLSNGEGCGRILPGTGIMLNNMLGEEDLNPRGFNAWPEGVRLASMMAPSLAYLADGGTAALGSGGSNRIRSAVLQVLLNLIDHDQPIAEAVRAPRLHVEDGLGNLEEGFAPAAVEALAAEVDNVKLWPRDNMFFGGVHAVSRLHRKAQGVGLEAAGDPRRGGVARIV